MALPLLAFEVAEMPVRRGRLAIIARDFAVIAAAAAVAIVFFITFTGGPHG